MRTRPTPHQIVRSRGDSADWRGREIVDQLGREIGQAEDVYLDLGTGNWDWVLVRTYTPSLGFRLVPLPGGLAKGETIQVKVTVDEVEDGPRVEPGRRLSEDEEEKLLPTTRPQGLGRSRSGQAANIHSSPRAILLELWLGVHAPARSKVQPQLRQRDTAAGFARGSSVHCHPNNLRSRYGRAGSSR